VVDAAIPELGCKFGLHFNHWSADAVKFGAEDKFDFVFIDAHHSHPWATLDTMLVLPLVKTGAWIAWHDIALHERIRTSVRFRSPAATVTTRNIYQRPWPKSGRCQA